MCCVAENSLRACVPLGSNSASLLFISCGTLGKPSHHPGHIDPVLVTSVLSPALSPSA